MGKPAVSDDQVRALHAEGKSRAAIARALGASPRTIGRVCDRLGLSFDRSGTEAATRAAVADQAARRAELAALLLDDAFRMRARVWDPYTIQAVSAEGDIVQMRYALPPAAETRNLVTSLAVLVDKHVSLLKVDADTTGVTAVDAWLRGMMGDAAVQAAGPAQ